MPELWQVHVQITGSEPWWRERFHPLQEHLHHSQLQRSQAIACEAGWLQMGLEDKEKPQWVYTLQGTSSYQRLWDDWFRWDKCCCWKSNYLSISHLSGRKIWMDHWSLGCSHQISQPWSWWWWYLYGAARRQHQQKTFPLGRNGSVRVDELHQGRQRHPGGGLPRAQRQYHGSHCISPSDHCVAVSSRSVSLLL